MKFKKFIITAALLILAAVSPNLFVAAQAGIAPFSVLAVRLLIPSVVLILIIILMVSKLKINDIKRLAIHGIMAGIMATVSLEIVRETGFRTGAMPGDLPRLMGVLIMNQFASGPDTGSDLAGWAYHFWNGAAFGLIFSLLLGQGKMWQGILYGLLIGLVFMVSPVVTSLGIGKFGLDFKDGYQFALTVTIAHLAFGVTLSMLLLRWNKGLPDVIHRFLNQKS